MAQISYNGYAQRTSFDPIKAPDETSRILQEGQRTIRGMQAVSDQDRRNRQEYLSALEQKQNNEQQNRQANRNLQKSFDATYQNALQRNYKIKVDNAYREAENSSSTWNAIAKFSETAAKLATGIQQKKDEANELAGKMAIFESGVSYEEAMQLRAGEAQLDAADTAYSKLAQDLQARGVSAEQISQIRKLSGRQWYGAMQAFAINGVDEYPQFRAERANVEYDVNGEKFSLETAVNAGPTVWAAVNAQIRSEFLGKYKGIDNVFLDKYLYSGMRQIEAQEKASFANDREKMLSAEFQETQKSQLVTQWKADGGAGVVDWIQRTSGGTSVGLRNQRLAAMSVLVDAAKNGDFTANDLVDLESAEVTLKGAKGGKRFGELYSSETAQIRKAIKEFNISKYREDEMQQEMEEDTYQEEIIKIESERGPYSESELKAIKSEYERRFLKPAPGWIMDRVSTQELEEGAGRQLLDQRVADGTLTSTYLNSGRFSTKLRLDYQKYAQQQESKNKVFSEASYKRVEAALKEQLGTLASPAQGSLFFALQPLLVQDVEQRARVLMDKGAQASEAYQQAGADVQKEVEAGLKGQGRYARKLDVNGKPIIGTGAGFRILEGNSGERNQRKRAAEIRQAVESNKNAVRNRLLLTPSEVKAVEGTRRGGAIPPAIWQLSRLYPTLDPYEIMDKQMEFAKEAGYTKLDSVTRPPEAEMYDFVRPELKRYLTDRPSLSRTGQASYQAGSPQPYKPLLELIASKESRSTDPGMDGYDALNRGGSNNGHTAHGSSTGSKVFGRPLTKMTVGEIMNLQASGKLHATGRYQIIANTLKSLVDQGHADRNDIYDQATQDRLAVALIHRRAGSFFRGNRLDAETIQGMGNEWVGLQNLPASQLRAAMEQAKANLNNPNFDVANMKRQVVYKVGNIGPTSTGAHLHVDVEGANGYVKYGRGTLDRYVSFVTPKGVVPLSSGVTVGGGEQGANRSYGGHTGWDFAMPQGTQVAVTNGARVLGVKRNTEVGDIMTIGLPDGRRIRFIHGNAG